MNFYGDNLRWFVGQVVANNDPLSLGRLQVKIFGVHDSIDNEDLPWSQVVLPVTDGGTGGNSSITGLLPGARVFGFFMDGANSQSPLIIGSIPKYEENSTNGKSTPPRAAGTDNLDYKATKTDPIASEPADPFNAVYPNNNARITHSGHVIEFDDTEDAERIMILHKSGSFIEMHPNGDMVTRHKNGFRGVIGTDNLYVQGDLNITVTGTLNFNAEGGDVKANGVSLVNHTHTIDEIDGNDDVISRTSKPS